MTSKPVFDIRQSHLSDLPALYNICLKTGLAGKDATGHVDEEILGHYYVAPYLAHEIDMCLTLTKDGSPIGYIVGTTDTLSFDTYCEANWWPVLRERYAKPEADDQSLTANMIRTINERASEKPVAKEYPAHLHINILPIAQGTGLGKQLIQRFKDKLSEKGIKGLHFGVSNLNEAALGFYQHVGFSILEKNDGATIMGVRLESPKG